GAENVVPFRFLAPSTAPPRGQGSAPSGLAVGPIKGCNQLVPRGYAPARHVLRGVVVAFLFPGPLGSARSAFVGGRFGGFFLGGDLLGAATAPAAPAGAAAARVGRRFFLR